MAEIEEQVREKNGLPEDPFAEEAAKAAGAASTEPASGAPEVSEEKTTDEV